MIDLTSELFQEGGNGFNCCCQISTPLEKRCNKKINLYKGKICPNISVCHENSGPLYQQCALGDQSFVSCHLLRSMVCTQTLLCPVIPVLYKTSAKFNQAAAALNLTVVKSSAYLIGGPGICCKIQSCPILTGGYISGAITRRGGKHKLS